MDASDKGFLNISCYKYNSFKNCDELAWHLISCWLHILQQLKSVASLSPCSVWRHLCTPLFRCQKSMFWWSQEWRIGEVKLFSSLKWELDTKKENSFPSGRLMSTGTRAQISWFLSTCSSGCCAMPCLQGCFSDKNGSVTSSNLRDYLS